MTDLLNLLLLALVVHVVQFVSLIEIKHFLESGMGKFLHHHIDLSFSQPLLQEPFAPVLKFPLVYAGTVPSHVRKLLSVIGRSSGA